MGFGELKSFPTLLGAPHGTLRTSPQNCKPPAQPSAPLGDQCISPALPSLPLNPLLQLPKATWSCTAVPKMHRGRYGGHTSTLTSPALLATLPYTWYMHSGHGAGGPRSALLQAPVPINIQEMAPVTASGHWFWGAGMPLSQAAAAPAPPRSGHWW